jgi:hypothetical protein
MMCTCSKGPGARLYISDELEGWDVAWWYSACLACMRPGVRSQHQKIKDKKKKKPLLWWTGLYISDELDCTFQVSDGMIKVPLDSY